MESVAVAFVIGLPPTISYLPLNYLTSPVLSGLALIVLVLVGYWVTEPEKCQQQQISRNRTMLALQT